MHSNAFAYWKPNKRTLIFGTATSPSLPCKKATDRLTNTEKPHALHKHPSTNCSDFINTRCASTNVPLLYRIIPGCFLQNSTLIKISLSLCHTSGISEKCRVRDCCYALGAVLEQDTGSPYSALVNVTACLGTDNHIRVSVLNLLALITLLELAGIPFEWSHWQSILE